MFESVSPGATVIAAIGMIILILWEQPFMKRVPAFKIIQGPLVTVLTGIGLNVAFSNSQSLALKGKQLVSIPVADSIMGFFGQFTTPDFSQITNPLVLTTGLTIAIVASLETLLCVEATDKLDPLKRVTPTNRELVAQGIGNMVSGFIGGLPVTQVIVRSSANIQSGGRTKASAVFHGVLLFVCVLAIPNILNMIPLASLAAILFVVGYKLAKPVLFKQMYAGGHEMFVPFMITILGIVFTDLLIGIGLGLAVAIMFVLWNNYRAPYHFHPENHKPGTPYNIKLADEVTFLNKASILHTLELLPNGCKVHIDGRQTKSIHPDVIEIIDDFVTNAKTRDISVTIEGLEELDKSDVVRRFGRYVLHGGEEGE